LSVSKGYSATISRASLTENLSQHILEMIQADGLKPGDRLPALAALAQRFSVANPTVREALRRLEATGVVDIRHGSGVYLRDGADRSLMLNPHQGRLDERKILELLQARSFIEPQLAGLTARWCTDGQVEQLEVILREAERYLEGNDRALHDANAAFHLGIARFAGNTLLYEVVESFTKLYSFEQLVILELYNARSRDYDDHRRIFRAIQDRNPLLAHQLMQRHLEDVRKVVEARLKGGDLRTLLVNPDLE
jgi:GntR family transcriptional repressor for pyruvate dehydrogenase complex